MRREYQTWLRRQRYREATVTMQLYRVARVEESYGDLDNHYYADRLESLIRELEYSTDDERRDRPNPTRIEFNGNIRSNLASYRTAVRWYRRFRDGEERIRSNGASDHDASPLASSTSAAPDRSSTPIPKGFESTDPADEVRSPPETGTGVGWRITLLDVGYDGRLALERLVATSAYETLAQAVASLTLFSHPDTVRQTGGRGIFPTVRDQKNLGRGTYTDLDGRRVMLDDNLSPAWAFLWSNGLRRRPRDTQINHVHSRSLDPDAYTSLANLCLTPAFLAKLTDTHDEITALLKYRAFELYGWAPAGVPLPAEPSHYAHLEWAPTLPAVSDLPAAIGWAMSRKPKDRVVRSAIELGWLFGSPTA